MREAVGDLFTYPADCIVIPTNWATKWNGDAVMGAGVAKEAARRWPFLPRSLGNFIRTWPGAPTVSGVWTLDGLDVVCLPTKRDWREPSEPWLIEQMAYILDDKADRMEWETVALPRLGCGLGQLDWESQVRPLLAGILDDRFVALRAAAGGGGA